MTTLEQMGWIDRQTRAVFAEFAVFNPFLNLFIVATMVHEFLPTGNVVSLARFDPIDLFNGNSLTGFRMLCNVVYMIFIIYYMLREIKNIFKYRLNYFGFWPMVEWGIIISSWTGFGIYIYKMKTADRVSTFFAQTKGYQYIKLQNINDWNQVFQSCIGFCAFLGTLKFMKVLRFNTKINYLSETLHNAVNDLIGFFLVFIICWMAFVQLMYLVFVNDLIGYSSILKSMESSFQIMVGKFDAQSMFEADPYLGPFIFVAYNAMIIFFMVNILISLIGMGFTKTRFDEKTKEPEIGFIEHYVHRMKVALGIKKQTIEDLHRKINKNKIYTDYINVFPYRLDNLMYVLISKYPKELENVDLNIDNDDILNNEEEKKKARLKAEDINVLLKRRKAVYRKRKNQQHNATARIEDEPDEDLSEAGDETEYEIEYETTEETDEDSN
jgi:hypothetical protein